MSTRFVLHINPDNFEVFRANIFRFPFNAYEDFLAAQKREIDELEANGREFALVEVTWEQFDRYCSSGPARTYQTLRAIPTWIGTGRNV